MKLSLDNRFNRLWNTHLLQTKEAGLCRGFDLAIIERSYLHAIGYRLRLHRKNLPDKPDIILPRFKDLHIHRWPLLASMPSAQRRKNAEKLTRIFRS